jgi:uncharacterized protein involved in outer membrane biogenesis
MKRVALGLAILLFICIGGFGAAIVTLNSVDWSEYEGPIAKIVKEATGRELQFDGAFKVQISLSPSINVDGVRLRNLDWGTRDEMLLVEHAEAQLKLLPLIFGRIELNRIEIIGLDLLLETNKDGEVNWEFAPPDADVLLAAEPEGTAESEQEAMLTSAILEKAVIKNASIIYTDGVTGDSHHFRINEFTAQMDSIDAPLVIELEALYQDETVSLEGKVSGVNGILKGEPLGLEVAALALGSSLEVEGTVGKPLESDGILINVKAEGDSLGRLTEFAGAPVAELGAYTLAANISGSAESLAISDLIFHLEAAGAKVRVGGQVGDAILLTGIDLNLAVGGESLASLSAVAGSELPYLGAYRGAANISGSAESLALSDLVFQLEAAGATVNVAGHVDDTIELTGIDIKLDISGDSLASLSVVAGSELPNLGAYRVAANIAGTSGVLDVSDLSIDLGETHIDGNLTAEIAATPMHLDATIRSPLIDLTYLLPADPDSPTSVAETNASSGSSQRVFPDDPLPLDSLNALDTIKGFVNLEIDELIVDSETTVTDLKAGIRFAPGSLALKPLQLVVMDATIDGQIGLEAANDSADLGVTLNIRHPQIGDFVAEEEGTMLAGGPLDMDIDVSGRGGSVRDIMASLNGSVDVELGTAKINNKWVQRAFADAKSMVKRGESKPVDLHCVTTQFNIKNGVAVPESLVVDTRGVSMFGDGQIDLGAESIELNFDRLAASVSASSALPPFRVRGTFSSPTGGVDAGALGKNIVGFSSALITKSDVERSEVSAKTGPNRCRQRLVVYEQVQDDRERSKEKTADMVGKAAESTKFALGKVGGFFKRKNKDAD